MKQAARRWGSGCCQTQSQRRQAAAQALSHGTDASSQPCWLAGCLHSPSMPAGFCQVEGEATPYQDPGTVTLGLRETLPNGTGGHMAARPTHFSHLSGERTWQQGRGMGPGRATILTGRPWPGKASKASQRQGSVTLSTAGSGAGSSPDGKSGGMPGAKGTSGTPRQEPTRVIGSWLQSQARPMERGRAARTGCRLG